jgi:periplasmic divalent cation tolerance protein
MPLMGGSGVEQARVVLVTAPDLGCARTLARGLVEQRLAACVNLVPGLESVYRWKGAIESSHEVLLLVKTAAARLPALEAYLESQHPYDVPECIALQPARVERAYLDWLLAEAAP